MPLQSSDVEIRNVSVDANALASYEQLFRECFPRASYLDANYLEWLYARNPAGTVIGRDAWVGDLLVAHYACIPVVARFGGHKATVMLSLNTATHPDFQGKGLFTRLAEATYTAGVEVGMAAVYGVANANSTPGFTRKLGFTMIRPLDARIGVGRLERDPTSQVPDFCRDWTEAALSWRVSNPHRRYELVRAGDGVLGAETHTGKPFLRAWDELMMPSGMRSPDRKPALGVHLHLGLRPGNPKARGSWMDIPRNLRPSPLNLIFRPMAQGVMSPAPDSVNLGLLDFDAF